MEADNTFASYEQETNVKTHGIALSSHNIANNLHVPAEPSCCETPSLTKKLDAKSAPEVLEGFVKNDSPSLKPFCKQKRPQFDTLESQNFEIGLKKQQHQSMPLINESSLARESDAYMHRTIISILTLIDTLVGEAQHKPLSHRDEDHQHSVALAENLQYILFKLDDVFASHAELKALLNQPKKEPNASISCRSSLNRSVEFDPKLVKHDAELTGRVRELLQNVETRNLELAEKFDYEIDTEMRADEDVGGMAKQERSNLETKNQRDTQETQQENQNLTVEDLLSRLTNLLTKATRRFQPSTQHEPKSVFEIPALFGFQGIVDALSGITRHHIGVEHQVQREHLHASNQPTINWCKHAGPHLRHLYLSQYSSPGMTEKMEVLIKEMFRFEKLLAEKRPEGSEKNIHPSSIPNEHLNITQEDKKEWEEATFCAEQAKRLAELAAQKVVLQGILRITHETLLFWMAQQEATKQQSKAEEDEEPQRKKSKGKKRTTTPISQEPRRIRAQAPSPSPHYDMEPEDVLQGECSQRGMQDGGESHACGEDGGRKVHVYEDEGLDPEESYSDFAGDGDETDGSETLCGDFVEEDEDLS